MSRVDELVAMLPGSMANDEAAQAFLAGVLTPVARVEAYLNIRARAVEQLLDPEDVPDALVPHLAALVGVGRDLPAANLATVAELRRLIVVAVALWKEKGSRESWRDVVSVLAGKRALILDWFYLRAIEGTYGEIHVLPAPGSAPGGHYDYPERVTDLWYMDPEGLVNALLVRRFLDVCRPAGERINVYVASFVEDCGAGWGLWSQTGTGTFSADVPGQTLTLQGPAVALMDAGGTEASWTAYHAFLRLSVASTGLILALATDVDNAYEVKIDQGAGTVALLRRVAGIATTLATVAQATAAGFAYRWSVEVDVGASSTLVRVIFEAAVLIEYLDADAARMLAGTAGYGVPASSTAVLTAALVYPFSISPTRVGPDP